MCRYARQLKERVDEGELAGSTAHLLELRCDVPRVVRLRGLVAENLARGGRAEEELPGKHPRSDRQQFRSRADRKALLTHLYERAHYHVKRLEESAHQALPVFRTRTINFPTGFHNMLTPTATVELEIPHLSCYLSEFLASCFNLSDPPSLSALKFMTHFEVSFVLCIKFLFPL